MNKVNPRDLQVTGNLQRFCTKARLHSIAPLTGNDIPESQKSKYEKALHQLAIWYKLILGTSLKNKCKIGIHIAVIQ